MRKKHIFWGVLFISFGLIVFLYQVHLINFDLSFGRLVWPLVFVFWGLSLLKLPPIAKMISSGAAGLTLAIFFAGIFFGHYWGMGINSCWDFNDDDDFTKVSNGRLVIPFDSSYINATFKFDGGAGSFTLNDTCTSSNIAVLNSDSTNSVLELSENKATHTIIAKMSTHRGFGWLKKRSSGNTNLELSPYPIWDCYFNIGAAQFESNLSKFKIKSLEVNAGAADIEITLGSLLDTTNLNVNAGASSVEINIPQTSGCEIVSKTGLSNLDLEGFFKTNDKTWRTKNYDSTKAKIFIDISGGVSSFEVKKY